MELALALLRLWQRRVWVAVGIAVAIAVGAAGAFALAKTAYSSASTQMIIDAPESALGNLQTSLTPFTNRAIVFARLMVSSEALNYIGRDAGIPGNEISAVGPAEIGAPQAVHKPTALRAGRLVAPSAKYGLRLDQNPELPTIDIYAEAPTTRQADGLANGAVTGFTKYLTALDQRTGVPVDQRVKIRQLGQAEGGIVNSSSGTELGALIGFLVFLGWCGGVLYLTSVRARLRSTRELRGVGADAVPAPAAGAGAMAARAPLAEDAEYDLLPETTGFDPEDVPAGGDGEMTDEEEPSSTRKRWSSPTKGTSRSNGSSHSKGFGRSGRFRVAGR